MDTIPQHQDYIRARNESSHESRRARKDFAAETKTNNKGFWNYVNSRRKTRTKIADLRTNLGAFTRDILDKADILNKQYANTFTVEDLSSTPNFRPRQLQTQPLEKVQLTEEMVHKKLQSLRSDKSPGPDKLHPRILQELAKELTTPLAIIYNKCIDKGTLPSQWKEAIVTPIFKKGCKSDLGNYRPVSLTSVVCKVMERMISENILEHVKSNSIQCSQQDDPLPETY